jgi:Family of unknown function (DUF5995)
MMTGIRDAPAQQVHRIAMRIARYLTRYDAAHDPRAVFAYTYLRLTTELEASLRAGNAGFRSPAWVADLAESLAAEYFAAMDGIDEWLAAGGGPRTAPARASDLPDEIPQPWRDVYTAIADGRSYVLEDVLFAMFAHISYDLPIALQRMAQRTDVGGHIADFHTMNDVLGAAIDVVQREVASRYSSGLAELDRLLARQDEILSNYGIRLSRGTAWYNFERLQDPAATADALRSIRNSTGSLVHEVRSPDDWRLRLAVRVGRWLIPARRQWPVVEHPDAAKWQVADAA